MDELIYASFCLCLVGEIKKLKVEDSKDFREKFQYPSVNNQLDYLIIQIEEVYNVTEHPIMPIQRDKMLSSGLQTQASLILCVKTQTIEFNFFKEVDHEMMSDIMGKLLHEND